MKNLLKVLFLTLTVTFFALNGASYAGGWGSGKMEKNVCNPCNPCGKNMKNLCNPCGKKIKNLCNPCGIGVKNPCNPCVKQMKNPCNPCGKNSVKPLRKGNITDYSKLAAKGKRLWNDESLGKSGVSCMSCHAGHNLLNLDKVGFFPHYIAMPDDILTLDQMINFCMINPMKTTKIDPDSIEMTSMAAYYQEYIKSYKRPENVCNPCRKRMKNPCGEY